MRMTNKIIQNNSLYNINQNKVLQDKLSTQMSTQKKLTRPSDDPVVAIRALRLRSSVSELEQYEEKNAPDAESWLKVTADGLGTVTDILTDLSKNANKGANKDLTADDLDIIITQMRSLSEEFYSTGNLDYAGRYVFTGYRTDTPMQFTAADVANTIDPIPSYQITEQLSIADFDSINYTNIGNLAGTTVTNATDASHYLVEQDVKNADIHRLQLAYEKLDDSKGVTLTFGAANRAKGTGTAVSIPTTMTSAEDAYKAIADGTEEAVFISTTGELVFSDTFFKTNIETIGEDQEIRVTYDKASNSWENGDLRPEHYFACETTGADPIVYNQKYFTEGKEKQVISYDVGYNQTIEINTTADEVFNHSLTRNIDDLENALNELKNIEEIRDALDTAKAMETEGTPAYENLVKQREAAEKAHTYIREKLHDLLQTSITWMQGYLDSANVAVTDNGTRSSRLSLIQKRLTEQKTTFKTLQSDNEDADIAEVAVQLTSAELTYNASLTATGKIMNTTLMNFI